MARVVLPKPPAPANAGRRNLSGKSGAMNGKPVPICSVFITGPAIWQIHLRRPRKLEANLGIKRLVEASAGYTGAEIAETVVAAMYQAFDENIGPVTEGNLAGALRESVPMSQSHGALLAEMMAWGRAFAAPAN
jgi:hypothetical protein